MRGPRKALLWTFALLLAGRWAVAQDAAVGPASASAPPSGSTTIPSAEEQARFRQRYLAAVFDRTRQLVSQHNKASTEEERALIREHWRRVARLLRIREVAWRVGDPATVRRVDQLIVKMDRDYFLDLQVSNIKAPEAQPGGVTPPEAGP